MKQKKSFGVCRSVSRQTGAALIVVLVMLVAMTIAGLAGMQMTSLEERMSANSRDRILTLQAAESALRVGQVAAISRLSEVNPSCTNGLCSAGAAPDPVTYDWASGKHAVVSRSDASSGVSVLLSADPGFLVEKIGFRKKAGCGVDSTVPVLRVVSRAQGMDPTTVVLLESYVEAGC